MVREWRKIWEVGDFPFYYCQIAPYNYGNGLNSAFIREAQAKGMTTTPNTGMAVLMDSDSPNCIHPPKKKYAGERLALWALAKTYGMDKIHFRSPEVQSMILEGRVAVLTMDISSNPGLTTHGKEILQFQVAGEDKDSILPKQLLEETGFLFSPRTWKSQSPYVTVLMIPSQRNLYRRRKSSSFFFPHRRLVEKT